MLMRMSYLSWLAGVCCPYAKHFTAKLICSTDLQVIVIVIVVIVVVIVVIVAKIVVVIVYYSVQQYTIVYYSIL